MDEKRPCSRSLGFLGSWVPPLLATSRPRLPPICPLELLPLLLAWGPRGALPVGVSRLPPLIISLQVCRPNNCLAQVRPGSSGHQAQQRDCSVPRVLRTNPRLKSCAAPQPEMMMLSKSGIRFGNTLGYITPNLVQFEQTSRTGSYKREPHEFEELSTIMSSLTRPRT